MSNDKLNKKLEDIKKKIKANSKDAHFADALISDLLSIKGQMSIEPTIVHIPEADVVKKLKGETFEMAVTKHGDAVYHVYGGYTIIADGSRMRSLAQSIADYVIHQDLVNDLDEKERELYDLDMSATAYVLNIPMYAFSDQDLKYDLATKVVSWLRETFEKNMNIPLQDETPAEDAKFHETTMAIEDIKAATKPKK